MILHYLCPPTKTARNKEKNVWKFTVFDSQTSFMCLYETQDACTEGILNMVKKNKNYGVPSNLYINAVGDTIDEAKFQVTFDDITFLFNDILEAINFAFKAQMVFGLSYQMQSINFWELIQGCFSDIDVKDSSPALLRQHIREIRKNIYE